MRQVRIYKTPFDLAEALAKEILRQIAEAEADNRPFRIMLSGGSTPELLYKTILRLSPEGFHWAHVDFYWGDERCVSHEDSESNFGQARRIWLDQIHIHQKQLHPMYSGKLVEDERESMESVLQQAGIFDLVLLGMGEDGHFASVFPDRPNLFESKRWCETALHPVSKQARITVTPYFLQTRAKSIICTVTGIHKATAIEKIFRKDGSGVEYLPAAQLMRNCDHLQWFLDEQAASKTDHD